jgi:hypothetical protein
VVVFRIIVAVLPQILFLLFFGGRLDLLCGWNKMDSALGVLLVLFLLTPVATAILLLAEIIQQFFYIR